MDVVKYIWLIQNRSLYFPRIDKLGDPFEGYYTKLDASDLTVSAIDKAIIDNKINRGEKLLKSRELRDAFLNIVKDVRQRMFASCWHMNNIESYYMWKLYASHNSSIAIQTNYDTLCEALPDYCYAGKVRYIDYDSDNIGITNIFDYSMHKRVSYSHEAEIRSIIYAGNKETDKLIVDGVSVRVPIDINLLIIKVYISPQASHELEGIIGKLNKDYGISCEIIHSSVNSSPEY